MNWGNELNFEVEGDLFGAKWDGLDCLGQLLADICLLLRQAGQSKTYSRTSIILWADIND